MRWIYGIVVFVVLIALNGLLWWGLLTSDLVRGIYLAMIVIVISVHIYDDWKYHYVQDIELCLGCLEEIRPGKLYCATCWPDDHQHEWFDHEAKHANFKRTQEVRICKHCDKIQIRNTQGYYITMVRLEDD